MSDDIGEVFPVGSIHFASACPPALPAGDYSLSASLEVGEAKIEPKKIWKAYPADLPFSVDGPRFALGPEEIHSVYPPADATGSFDNALPHVVFTRRSLPWERAPEPTGPSVAAGACPWLGILLLEDGELSELQEDSMQRIAPYGLKSLPLVSGGTGKVDSLLFPFLAGAGVKPILVPNLGQGGLRGAETETKRWQGEKERYEGGACPVLDMPLGLFRKLAPRGEDLPFLVHARWIDTGDKELYRVNDRGWFSVAVCNRLPRAMAGHRAFLVSFEGTAHYWDASSNFDEASIARLVVLCSWSFSCGEGNDFKARMRQVLASGRALPSASGDPGSASDSEAPSDFWLRKSLKPGGAGSGGAEKGAAEAENTVAKAFELGYAAFNHALRNGEETVSWYRGPLVPLFYAQAGRTLNPTGCSDRLLLFNPRTGMFDTAYAAAWQLGRLLALQNQSFAFALGRARRAMLGKAEARWRREELGLREESFLEERLIAILAGKETAGGRRGGAGDIGADDAHVPDEVYEWLGRLTLLYGVPLPYLVPDADMLPENSLRFFYLDPLWIQCLIEGACSIGRNGYGDEVVDQAMMGHFEMRPEAESQGPVSKAAAGHRGELRRRLEGVEPAAKKSEGLRWPLSGFLLRSPVVKGWRGLEIKAYAATEEGGAALDPLRIEQLGPDVMLGIFNGKAGKLVIRQPLEGLHLGLTRDEGKAPVKSLRLLADEGEAKAGSPLSDPKAPSTGRVAVEAVLREEPDPKGVVHSWGVVEIARLAADIKARLAETKHLPEGKFGSAEFAIEMIEAAGEFTFDIRAKEPRK